MADLVGSVNWMGVRTLYSREVRRFMRVWQQTLSTPAITTLIWLAILTLALGAHRTATTIDGVPFTQFIAPGLIMMTAMQNAFANTSSSLILSKIQGVIVDVLMPPFSAGEITFAIIAGGATRGVLVGIIVALAISLFVPLPIPHPFLALFYLVLASTFLSSLGAIAGVWAQGFDQMNAFTAYFITPLTFLSGTFYSVNVLPGMWHVICTYNPFFYMIDGFRYTLTGYHDGSLAVGIGLLMGLNMVFWIVVRQMFASGWRLKS